MGRVAKKTTAAAAKDVEDSPSPTITQSRTRRTPKPNPKYNSENIIAPPKLDDEELGLSEGEDEPVVEAKVVKSVKKTTETSASVKGNKTPAPKGKVGGVAKKLKIEYADDDDEGTDDADEKAVEEEKVAPTTRATRSGKGAIDSLKIGDDSVAIVDVSSIISKAPDSPKNTRGGNRKRAVLDESPKEDQAKKKKEDEKPSLITARKSYMPPAKKPDPKEKVEVKVEEKKEDAEEKKKFEAVVRTPGITRPRRYAGAFAELPLQAEPVKKELKEEDVKVEIVKAEVKKLPVVKRGEQIVKVAEKSPLLLPTKAANTISPVTTAGLKPVPRLLNNTMAMTKAKQSPNVKLAGDGTDKKVFSIDLTDDSIKEKKIIASPIKPSPNRGGPIAAKENVAINKPQPSALLKNKLESELMRMKASANVIKRQQFLPQSRHSMPAQQTYFQNNASSGPRRITKFESWYVIDVKNLEVSAVRHNHTYSLINLGNNIKDLQLPSAQWDYKVTLQRRLPRKENNNEEEVYTGDVADKTLETDKANYEPNSILFKRSHRENSKITIDRSLTLKQNAFAITMNGKPCKLIGAPDDIKSLEDLEHLLSIIDSTNNNHSCVEVTTGNDNSIISIS